jgi:hypothetical protein
VVKLASVMMAAAFVAGFATPGDAQPALTYNPQHYQNNDPIWEVLNQTQVVANTASGQYNARFPRALTAMRDKSLTIRGFILPLEATSRSAHFMLVRRNTGCPFCPPNAPTEAVEVFAARPIDYTGEEIAVTGRLGLQPASDQGLFFRLDSANAVNSSAR